MTREVERIRREDTDELLEFLNKAFTGDPASGHFESNMPRMCRSEKRLCEQYLDFQRSRKITDEAVMILGLDAESV